MGTPDHYGAPIEVRVPASLGLLPTLRALTDTVALHGELTLDEVADLRLAVDEACSALIPAAVPGSALSCAFTITNDQAHVRITVFARAIGLPDEESFGWHVLRTLTSTLTVSQDAPDASGAGYPTVLEFTRARTTVSPDPR